MNINEYSGKRTFDNTPEPDGTIIESDEKNRFVIQKHQPMLATLTDRPFSKSTWLYELKLDGYRIIGCKKGDETELFSRNNNTYTKTYATIAGELSTLNAQFVIDDKLDPRKLTLATMRRRLERKGDLWQGILDHRVDMRKVLGAFEG
jgi:ATP-dependent DNA ligase